MPAEKRAGLRRLGIFLLLCWPLLPLHAETLRMAWGPHNAAPYAIVEENRLTGGIIHDLGLQLAAQLGAEARFVEVPRSRNEEQLRNRRVDVICITNPLWMRKPDDFRWSPRLFVESGAVVQRPGSTPWTALADLQGKHIGTILGYRYPNVEALFADGRAQRDDAADLESNMQRLVIGRVDAVIDADLPVRWWLQQNDAAHRYPLARFVTSQHDVQCAISKATARSGRTIERAFRRLQDDGTLPAMLQRYGVTDKSR